MMFAKFALVLATITLANAQLFPAGQRIATQIIPGGATQLIPGGATQLISGGAQLIPGGGAQTIQLIPVGLGGGAAQFGAAQFGAAQFARPAGAQFFVSGGAPAQANVQLIRQPAPQVQFISAPAPQPPQFQVVQAPPQSISTTTVTSTSQQSAASLQSPQPLRINFQAPSAPAPAPAPIQFSPPPQRAPAPAPAPVRAPAPAPAPAPASIQFSAPPPRAQAPAPARTLSISTSSSSGEENADYYIPGSPVDQYAFSFDETDEYNMNLQRSESVDENGWVSGQYSFRTPDGYYRIVRYISDELGFRAQVETNEPGTETSNPADAEIQSSAQPAAPSARR